MNIRMQSELDAISVTSLNDVAEWVVRHKEIPDYRVRISRTDCPLISPRQAITRSTLRKLEFIVAEYEPDGFALVENHDLSSSQVGRRLAIPFGGRATRRHAPLVGSLVNYGGLASTIATCLFVFRLKGAIYDTASVPAGG